MIESVRSLRVRDLESVASTMWTLSHPDNVGMTYNQALNMIERSNLRGGQKCDMLRDLTWLIDNRYLIRVEGDMLLTTRRGKAFLLNLVEGLLTTRPDTHLEKSIR